MERKTPLLMDVDTGVDDVLAIMLAFQSAALELIAITTVSGNTRNDQGSFKHL